MSERVVTGASRAADLAELPAEVLRRYRVQDVLLMEQRPDEIVLRPKRTRRAKLSWAETYRQMAQANEDWTDWEAAGEGLSNVPGEVSR